MPCIMASSDQARCVRVFLACVVNDQAISKLDPLPQRLVVRAYQLGSAAGGDCVGSTFGGADYGDELLDGSSTLSWFALQLGDQACGLLHLDITAYFVLPSWYIRKALQALNDHF